MDAIAPTEEAIANEQADVALDEDQFFDNPEDAIDALEDDMPEPEQPTDEESEEDSAPEEDESVLVDLDGEKLSLKELKAGYYRQKDYTQKTTEVAQERKAVAETKAQLAERMAVIETATQNLGAFLQKIIPPEPPQQLAFSDPGKHYALQMQRQAAMAELSELFDAAKPVQGVKMQVSEAEAKEYREREQAALVKAMPALADPVKKAAFDNSVKAAAKAFGFTDEEISATADNRVLRLVHYARIGQKAEENRKQAKARIETPRQGKSQPVRTAPVNVENKKAMHALAKTGSFKEAMKVDFE
jgi:hypothetical protein